MVSLAEPTAKVREHPLVKQAMAEGAKNRRTVTNEVCHHWTLPAQPQLSIQILKREVTRHQTCCPLDIGIEEAVYTAGIPMLQAMPGLSRASCQGTDVD